MCAGSQPNSGNIAQLHCDTCGRKYFCEERLRSLLTKELLRLGRIKFPETPAQYDEFVWSLQLAGQTPSAPLSHPPSPNAPMTPAAIHDSVSPSPTGTEIGPAGAVPGAAAAEPIVDAVAAYWAKIAVVQLYADSHDVKHRTSCFKNSKKKNAPHAQCRHNCPHTPVPKTSIDVGTCPLCQLSPL
jgi:hypothetical protein